MLKTDRHTFGSLVAHHRTRLGLTANGLASRTTTRSSSDIRDIERGLIPGLRPRAALALACALELDDWDTDRLLFLAGCAPRLDWQSLAEELLDGIGLGPELHAHAAARYAVLAPSRGQRRPPNDDQQHAVQQPGGAAAAPVRAGRGGRPGLVPAGP